ncbi:MAG: OmpA family protein [Flavobacteriales bacterium]
MFKYFILIFSLLTLFNKYIAQNQSTKQASKFFNKGDFEFALQEYSKLDTSLLSSDDDFKIGVCYFLSKNNQTKGIPHLKKYIQNTDSIIPVAYYYLGSLLHKNYEFDAAIQQLQVFLEKLELEYKSNSLPIDIYSEFKKGAEILIDNCNNGKIMVKSPRKVLVENLGDSINSKYQEYAPAISTDEKYLAFTSRRPSKNNSKVSDDGDFYEDIYLAELKKGSILDMKAEIETNSGFLNLVSKFEYSAPILLPEVINSKDHDASIQLSNDGNKLYFYRNSDVWSSEKNDTSWSTPIQLSTINSTSFEPSIFITLDEQTMFLTSEREGGYGKMDIYYANKDSITGNWGELINLGPKINTDSDEDISYVDPSKKVIYFSSKGHTSMGDYDIFKSINKNNEWSAPINMGSPINTPYNDAFFIMTPQYNRGYYASERPDGKGGMDIYRLTFANERNPLAELAGLVLQGDSLVPANSKITMKEIDSQSEITEQSKEHTGEYLLLVEHGKLYEMYVETEGFAPYKKTFLIPKQIEYFQLYQEIHHVYLRDSYGNIIGQQIITHNAFNDIENATRNDTLKQMFSKKDYSDYVRNNSNNSIEKFVDIKFYITEDSLKTLLQHDEKLKFIFPSYADISFAYNNDSEFRYALNSYINGNTKDLSYLSKSSIVINKMNTSVELEEELTKQINPFEKSLIVQFDFNEFTPNEVGEKELNIILNFMKANDVVKFLIKGHTDSKGSENYNKKLSVKRAQESYQYLISNGIEKSRLKFKGFGSSNPIAPNTNIDGSDNQEGRALNRRVEFEFIK